MCQVRHAETERTTKNGKETAGNQIIKEKRNREKRLDRSLSGPWPANCLPWVCEYLPWAYAPASVALGFVGTREYHIMAAIVLGTRGRTYCRRDADWSETKVTRTWPRMGCCEIRYWSISQRSVINWSGFSLLHSILFGTSINGADNRLDKVQEWSDPELTISETFITLDQNSFTMLLSRRQHDTSYHGCIAVCLVLYPNEARVTIR